MQKTINHNGIATVIDFGEGKFQADKERVLLLTALNECGLRTRSHCYGHETGRSFVTIDLSNVDLNIRPTKEGHELLINWKRTD